MHQKQRAKFYANFQGFILDLRVVTSQCILLHTAYDVIVFKFQGSASASPCTLPAHMSRGIRESMCLPLTALLRPQYQRSIHQSGLKSSYTGKYIKLPSHIILYLVKMKNFACQRVWLSPANGWLRLCFQISEKLLNEPCTRKVICDDNIDRHRKRHETLFLCFHVVVAFYCKGFYMAAINELLCVIQIPVLDDYRDVSYELWPIILKLI